jgi:Flp pilus assembly protein TadG
MLTLLLRPSRAATNERGQVMVIFAFAFVVIIMMLALLFDGASGMVLRRELKNTSDAAAMAGANILQSLSPSGCSTDAVGDPRAEVRAAVEASVAANMPGYDLTKVVVTCPGGLWNNSAVSVQLGQESPTFFGSIFNQGPLAVTATSAAVNGLTRHNEFSVVILNPYEPTWHSSTRGCPSFLINGGPTLTFQSTIFVDSACLLPAGGAFYTTGNSATLIFEAPPDPPGGEAIPMHIVGEYKPQALVVTPPPLEHQAYKPDPFLDIPEPPSSILKDWGSKAIGMGKSKQVIVLKPGRYTGGIKVGAQGVAYLEPGIYSMNGGGFSVQAGAQVFALPAGVGKPTYPPPADWANVCKPEDCGVLLYNGGTAGGSTKLGQFEVQAGATFKVRSYNPDIDTTTLADGTKYAPDPLHRHFLIWQTRLPAPDSNTYQQPDLSLSGGGTVFMAGTVYAPSAKVLMGGNSGGSGGGGGGTDLTLQFVAWELELSGNSTFVFRYNAEEFPTPLDYGLVE